MAPLRRQSPLNLGGVRCRLLTLTCCLLLILAGCSTRKSSGDENNYHVPLSSDDSLGFADLVRPPSERPEKAKGALVFMVDSATNSVYQFDVGRGRMLGPAPRRIGLDSKPQPLPGYPFVVGDEPPGDATILGSHLVVAGGDSGELVVFDYDQSGLRIGEKIVLPPFDVRTESGRESSGRPFVVFVASLGSDRVVALAHEARHGTTIAYEVDVDARRVVATTELPFGTPLAIAQSGSRVVATLSKGFLALIAEGLTVSSIPIPTGAHMIGAEGERLYVGVNEPARLLEVDLESSKIRELFRASTALAGPIVVDDSALWWTLASEGRLLRLLPTGEVAFEVSVCPRLKHLVAIGQKLLATCLQEGVLVYIDPNRHQMTPVGKAGSPTALVAA